MTKKWTTFTSIGSQDSLDKNKNFCGHSYKYGQNQYCGYCLEFFCHDCYSSHSTRFHPSVKVHKPSTKKSEHIEQDGTKPRITRDQVETKLGAEESDLYQNSDKLSLDDVQCQDDEGTNHNQSDFEEIIYETSLSFLKMKEVNRTKMKEVNRTNNLNNSFQNHVLRASNSIQQPKHNQYTRISGMILSGDLLIATDYCNKRVMVIDTNYYNLVTEHIFSTSPWDLTLIEKSYIAVTLTFERKIVFLRLHKNKLVFDKEVNVTGYCDGISAYRQTLLVTLVNPGSVAFIDHHGNIIKTIESADNGERLFDEPRHATFSNDGQKIYVSDFQKNSVVCISTGANSTSRNAYNTVSNSDIITEYKSKHLKGPESVKVDSAGHVYVCGSSSSCIHILSENCQQLYILYNEHIKYPQSLYCCLATRKLYIGLDGDTDILVFQLKIKEKNSN